MLQSLNPCFLTTLQLILLINYTNSQLQSDNWEFDILKIYFMFDENIVLVTLYPLKKIPL